jgi:hypothetical protein
MGERLTDSGDWDALSKKDDRALGRRQKGGTNKTLRFQPVKAGSLFAEYSAPTLVENGISMVFVI